VVRKQRSLLIFSSVLNINHTSLAVTRDDAYSRSIRVCSCLAPMDRAPNLTPGPSVSFLSGAERHACQRICRRSPIGSVARVVMMRRIPVKQHSVNARQVIQDRLDGRRVVEIIYSCPANRNIAAWPPSTHPYDPPH
jgi:hypothetical protein